MSNSKPSLIMLCGIPTSGKSSYVKTLITTGDYVILSTDNYIQRIADENRTTYNEIYDDFIEQATRRLFYDLKVATSNKRSIIWDQTNLTPKTRKQKLKKIPDNYMKTCIYFPITLEEAFKRNKERIGKIFPEELLEQMHSSFVIPTYDESWQSIINGYQTTFN